MKSCQKWSCTIRFGCCNCLQWQLIPLLSMQTTGKTTGKNNAGKDNSENNENEVSNYGRSWNLKAGSHIYFHNFNMAARWGFSYFQLLFDSFPLNCKWVWRVLLVVGSLGGSDNVPNCKVSCNETHRTATGAWGWKCVSVWGSVMIDSSVSRHNNSPVRLSLLSYQGQQTPCFDFSTVVTYYMLVKLLSVIIRVL